MLQASPRNNYFNSRPSARGDHRRSSCRSAPSISIHAPPRGATRGEAFPSPDDVISIHAPPRGATPAKVMFSFVRKTFQFTPLREGRRASAHTRSGDSNFNSRPSARGDLPLAVDRAKSPLFQFTPLREGRQALQAPINRVHGISIHAPPRGATAKDMQFLQIFCSTLTNQHGLTIVPRNLSRLFW